MIYIPALRHRISDKFLPLELGATYTHDKSDSSSSLGEQSQLDITGDVPQPLFHRSTSIESFSSAYIPSNTDACESSVPQAGPSTRGKSTTLLYAKLLNPSLASSRSKSQNSDDDIEEKTKVQSSPPRKYYLDPVLADAETLSTVQGTFTF